MSIITLLRKRLQKHASTVYLIFLAFADLCMLWTGLYTDYCFHGFGLDIKTTSLFSCKIMDFVAYASGGYSVWLIVLLTIERMMLTRFPIFSKSNLTRKFTLITAMVCLLIMVCLFFHIPFWYEIKVSVIRSENGTAVERVCTSTQEELQAQTSLWAVVLWIMFSLFPITILVIANGVIIGSIIFQRKRFCTVDPSGRVHQQNSYKKTKSLTRMILFVSAFFIFCTLPAIFKRAFESRALSIDVKEQARKVLIESVFLFVFYSNSTFNFILYCLSGSVFQQEFFNCISETKKMVFKFYTSYVCHMDSTSENTHTVNFTSRQTAASESIGFSLSQTIRTS